MPEDSDDEVLVLRIAPPSSSTVVPHQLPESPTTSKWHVLTYMVIFFLAMIVHELALEAGSREFSSLPGFAYSVTLVQFGSCVVLPLLATQGQAWKRLPWTLRQAFPYIKLSVVVFGATALASQALLYVTYPTKVVFKSAKLIPTMIVSTCWNGASYRYMDYVAAILLCIGAAGYSFGASTASNEGPNHSSWPGLILLTISILCDALVPNLQQQFMSPSAAIQSPTLSRNDGLIMMETIKSGKEIDIRRECELEFTPPTTPSLPLSPAELMVNVNAIGFSVLLCYMVFTGHLWIAVRTSTEHPRLALYFAMVGMGLSIAVLAYTKLIQASGSVVAVAVSTLRKVVTVVLSYLVFPKPLLFVHLVSGVAVLGGVVLSDYNSKQKTTRI